MSRKLATDCAAYAEHMLEAIGCELRLRNLGAADRFVRARKTGR